ncbi:hypothetical protein D3C86_1943370 [compost metagenome]
MRGKESELPPIKGSEYVAEIAFDIGLSEMTWQGIHAWCAVKQVALTPWESNAVMEMARAYAAAVNEYRDKIAAPPYMPGVVNRDKIAADVRQALRRRR